MHGVSLSLCCFGKWRLYKTVKINKLRLTNQNLCALKRSECSTFNAEA